MVSSAVHWLGPVPTEAPRVLDAYEEDSTEYRAWGSVQVRRGRLHEFVYVIEPDDRSAAVLRECRKCAVTWAEW